MSLRIPRRQYADLYGPTSGDRVRLADTDLLIEIERDLTRTRRRGEVRRRQGDPRRHGPVAAGHRAPSGALDLVDHQRADPRPLGHRQGRHRHPRRPHRRRSARPATPTSWTASRRAWSSARRPRSSPAKGRIVTAGGIDSHIHFICPQQVDEALSAGITTLIGGGTGPATGTNATTCTPGAWNIHRMLEAVGRAADQLRLSRQGQRLAARAAPRADRGGRRSASSCTRTGARRRRRSTARLSVADEIRRAGGDPHRHAERGGLRRGHDRARSRAGRSTPITPRARAAATRPTSSASAASPTACRPPPTRRCRSP